MLDRGQIIKLEKQHAERPLHLFNVKSNVEGGGFTTPQSKTLSSTITDKIAQKNVLIELRKGGALHKLHSCLDEEELSPPFLLLGQRKKYFFLVVIALALAWSKKIRMFFFVVIALALVFLPTWYKKERFFEVILMILNNRSQSYM